MTNRKRGSDVVSKEVLIGHIEPGARLAQIVVRLTDSVGAVASVNALLASLNVDVRQSMTHSLPKEGNAIFNAFVVLADPKVSLEQVIENLKLSPFVVRVQGLEGRDGAIVDTLSFPVGWQGKRVAILAQYAMARMLDGIRELLGTGGHVVLYELGTDYGRELASYLANRIPKEYLLHNYPYWLDVLSATGWGVPDLENPEDDFSNATIKLSSCIECEGRNSNEVVCSFARGLLAGIYSELAGYRVHCEEIKCAARGEGHCEFQLRSGRSVIAR